MVGLLHDEHPLVRAAAVRALGDSRAVTPLLQRVNKSGLGRRAVIRALGALGDARIVQPLLAIKYRVDVDDREAMWEALGRVGDPRAVPALFAAIPENVLRQHQLDASGDPESTSAIHNYLRCRKPALDAAIAALDDADAATCLRGIPVCGYSREFRAQERLVALLGHPDPSIRTHAAVALGTLGDPASAPALAAHLADEEAVRDAVRAGWRP